MLKCVLVDTNGSSTSLTMPVNMSIISSSDAPADSFSAVFALSGAIPELLSVKVLYDNDVIFYGYTDEQTSTITEKGTLLEVKARSLAAILLDNEAKPQVICLPSMKLLFQTNFKPLGLKGYIGPDKAYIGDLVISKGMSEWEVLSTFCKKGGFGDPSIDHNGFILFDRNASNDIIYINSDHPRVRISKKIKRSILISDVYARTHKAGGYEYHINNDFAKNHGIRKIRYTAPTDNEMNSIVRTYELLKKSNSSYKTCIVNAAGIIPCRLGDKLKTNDFEETMRITQICYGVGAKGYFTRISAEEVN